MGMSMEADESKSREIKHLASLIPSSQNATSVEYAAVADVENAKNTY